MDTCSEMLFGTRVCACMSTHTPAQSLQKSLSGDARGVCICMNLYVCVCVCVCMCVYAGIEEFLTLNLVDQVA